jgi:antitoxin CptB
MRQLAIFTPGPDAPDVCRRKLMFRSRTRGTQESDLILGSFADAVLKGLDDAQLKRFEALLDCSDPDLFDWIFEIDAPPPEHDHDVMRRLREFCGARGFRAQPAGRHQA